MAGLSPIRAGLPVGLLGGGFGPQHTDLPSRCYPFPALFAGMPHFADRGAQSAAIGFGLWQLAGLGVVLGEGRGHREFAALGVVDAAPAVDPWGRLVVTLDV